MKTWELLVITSTGWHTEFVKAQNSINALRRLAMLLNAKGKETGTCHTVKAVTFVMEK